MVKKSYVSAEIGYKQLDQTKVMAFDPLEGYCPKEQ